MVQIKSQMQQHKFKLTFTSDQNENNSKNKKQKSNLKSTIDTIQIESKSFNQLNGILHPLLIKTLIVKMNFTGLII